jgi:prepilin-type N-terminal cleavage/methylation domain-containing protein
MRRLGFTLIELMLAIAILTIVLTGVARYTAQFMHAVSTSTTRTTAAQVATERIELVKTDPSYLSLASVWDESHTGFPGYPNMTRTTTVSRITGTAPQRDYTVVTVRVTEPTLSAPVNVTTVVGRP